jgi:VanZ family protein
MRRARRVLLVAILIGLFVAVMLSSTDLALLRRAHPWLSRFMSRLEHLSPGGFDLDHVFLFAVLAMALRLLMPRMRGRIAALALAVLAVMTEALQFWSDGRTPLWSDVGANLVGAAVGMVLMLPWTLWVGARRRSKPGS